MNLAWQQKAGYRLHMPAAQPAPGPERSTPGPRSSTRRVGAGRIRNLRDLRTGHELILMETDLESPHAHLRVHLQGMPPPIRGAHLRQTESRMSQVSRHQTGAAALGLRGVREGIIARSVSIVVGSLRILRRSSRPRQLLARRHELDRGAGYPMAALLSWYAGSGFCCRNGRRLLC
jgi:hypothetical protein